MLVHFNIWCIKDIRKTKSGPEKQWDPQCFNTRGPNGPRICGLISTPEYKETLNYELFHAMQYELLYPRGQYYHEKDHIIQMIIYMQSYYLSVLLHNKFIGKLYLRSYAYVWCPYMWTYPITLLFFSPSLLSLEKFYQVKHVSVPTDIDSIFHLYTRQTVKIYVKLVKKYKL